jgi:hypothetical protein
MAHTSKGKTISLPRTFNLSTGKESMCYMGFNDTMWGKATHGYIKSVCLLSNIKFNAIVQAAQLFMMLKSDHVCNKASEVMEVISIDDDDDDRWAHLVYDSDDNEECMLHFLLMTMLT